MEGRDRWVRFVGVEDVAVFVGHVNVRYVQVFERRCAPSYEHPPERKRNNRAGYVSVEVDSPRPIPLGSSRMLDG